MNKTILLFSLMTACLVSIGEPAKSMLGANGIEILYDNNSPLPEGVVPIEYIESTGAGGIGQFIDTGVFVNAQTDVIICRMSFTRTYQYSTVFGVNQKSRFTARMVQTGKEWEFQGPSGLSGQPINLNEIYNIKIASNDNGGSSLNDIIGSFTPSSSYIFTKSLYLFAVHDYSGAWNLDAGWRSAMRLYEFRIIRDEEVLCDMIPVRVENEGFMYDRVSGELFGNEETGKFILGPDL